MFLPLLNTQNTEVCGRTAVFPNPQCTPLSSQRSQCARIHKRGRHLASETFMTHIRVSAFSSSFPPMNTLGCEVMVQVFRTVSHMWNTQTEFLTPYSSVSLALAIVDIW